MILKAFIAALSLISLSAYAHEDISRTHTCQIHSCSANVCGAQVVLKVVDADGTAKVDLFDAQGHRGSYGFTPFHYIETDASLPTSNDETLNVFFEIGQVDPDQVTEGTLWFETGDELRVSCQTTVP